MVAIVLEMKDAEMVLEAAPSAVTEADAAAAEVAASESEMLQRP